MTIRVLHDLMPIAGDTKIVFLSFRGEAAQQLRINTMVIEDRALMPAAFYFSVFNAPPALAAMALHLTAGYSAVYPGEDRFYSGFLAAAAPVLSGAQEETALVYADELVPEAYRGLLKRDLPPLAFAALLSRKPGGIPLAFPPQGGTDAPESPQGFLNSPEKFLDSPEGFLRYLYITENSGSPLSRNAHGSR
jgi:hypothetical protein